MSAEQAGQAGEGPAVASTVDAGDVSPPADRVDVAALARVLVAAPLERHWLDRTSWVDIGRGWLPGADELYQRVRDATQWRAGAMWRYEKYVVPPRLSAWYDAGRPPPVPELTAAHAALRRRYGIEFDGYGMSYYRDGADSVAVHRDKELRWLDDTVIAILTLGARRPWTVKPVRLAPGRRILNDPSDATGLLDLAPGSGDLLVLGGRAQADWLHGVPKVAGHVSGRISVQWRWTSRTGKPLQGAGYAAARHFGR
ncbi:MULTISPECIES: alpha-ketoglutarate-dependent dioxygenase AlkB [unclassified Pseudofrankia]|uniref:alpha-ketoglutarate-dependent dioxygenase AlkB n=1 Tax=unclassified Pseudofrankia TaxID=2994372 RepID=UPI0009F5F547|nr:MULTISPECIES: alpha-ketoglutarate-dependent dioxygenase AlkB [unclassified Pseudofrankia]MDT3446656.1 alpha-ketoglutarate-dependent dioxygenase AlkB [Pseudofrankia sp. BMG5.37]